MFHRNLFKHRIPKKIPGKLQPFSGVPSSEQLTTWMRSQTIVSINSKTTRSPEINITIQGTITNIYPKFTFYSMWGPQDLNPQVVVALDQSCLIKDKVSINYNDILSVSYDPEINIRLKSQSLPAAQVLVLTTGNYKIPVNKQALTDKCEFFATMLQSAMCESQKDEIDLTQFCDEQALKLLLGSLDNSDEPEYSVQSLQDAFTLVVIGDAISSQEVIDNGLRLIYSEIDTIQDLFSTAKKHDLHPFIANWIDNIKTWFTKYPYNGSKGCFIFNEICRFLYITPEQYKKDIFVYGEKLALITGQEWNFDGYHFALAGYAFPNDKTIELSENGVIENGDVATRSYQIADAQALDSYYQKMNGTETISSSPFALLSNSNNNNLAHVAPKHSNSFRKV